MLNTDQKLAFKYVMNRKNVLIPSSAGTGKSFFLKHVYEWAKNTGVNFGLTSSTGTSALNLGNGMAKTLHSFLGIFLAKKPSDQLAFYTMKKNPALVSKLKNLHILCIDEISMINSELFDKCSEYLSIIRKNKAPFGGLQIIITGDFFQIPPVVGEYCFKSKVWKSIEFYTFDFKIQVRQNNDPDFQQILEHARYGELTDESFKRLRENPKPNFGAIIPTILYSTNIDVDKINLTNYEKLIQKGSRERTYTTIYSKTKYTKAWADSLKIPESINLCIGSQVMLSVNMSIENGLVNGSRGVVVDVEDVGATVQFTNGEQYLIEPWTYIDEDDTLYAISMPLKLCWAMTIHKSQSATLDAVVTNLGPRIFTCGQAYVALSRVRDLKSIQFLDISKDSFKADEDVKEFYKFLKYVNSEQSIV